MQDIDDYISSIIGNRKISEELGKWLIKKSQYVRKRIVLTLPVSNRQGIFLLGQSPVCHCGVFR